MTSLSTVSLTKTHTTSYPFANMAVCLFNLVSRYVKDILFSS